MDFDATALPVALEGRSFRGDLDIRVDAHGAWHYSASPIQRDDMVSLFASMLVRDKRGLYWLVTPTELGRIEVEDAPLLVVDMRIEGTGKNQKINLHTNVGQVIPVSPQTPLVIKRSPLTDDWVPYITNLDGIEAKLTRAAYYSLVDQCVSHRVSEEEQLGVWSRGAFFPLGSPC